MIWQFKTAIGILGISTAFILGDLHGNYRGNIDATPISAQRRYLNEDGVEDLILTSATKNKEVLFGVPKDLQVYNSSSHILIDKRDYMSIDELKEAMRKRRLMGEMSKLETQYNLDKNYEKSLEEAVKSVEGTK